MANFPALSTGAVTQYPLQITVGQASQVIRFLDGSDQRYRSQGRTLRRWQIRLDRLNETEISAVEGFFVSQMGTYSTFDFPDPYSETSVPNCRFAADTFIDGYEGVDSSSTSFWIAETNG